MLDRRLAHPGIPAGWIHADACWSVGVSANRRPEFSATVMCPGAFVATWRLHRGCWSKTLSNASARPRRCSTGCRSGAFMWSWVPGRSVRHHHGAVHHRRRRADPPVLDRVHARRPEVLQVLPVPEPVRVLDADAGARRNMLVTFLGWEGVGTCSYLLISFWFTRDSAATAGKKAFVTNRIGDFGFMLAMFLTFRRWGRSAPRPTSRRGRVVRHHDGNRDRAVALPGCLRQERAATAVRVAARRHGRPDAGVGADPRCHHGHRRACTHGAGQSRCSPRSADAAT